METLNKRLAILIERLNFTSLRKFDTSIGVALNQTNNIVGEKQCLPGSSYLLKLKAKYPNVDLNWLISGQGEMFFAPKDDYKKLLEEKENLAQENSSLRNELQGSLFALSLVGRNANFPNVSMDKPVRIFPIIFANSLANITYSKPISA